MFEGEIYYDNQNAGRRKYPLDPELESILKKVTKKYGLDVRVKAGGQKRIEKGTHGHDLSPAGGGRAGDVVFTDKSGKPVSIEKNKPLFESVFSELVENGVTAIGYGTDYMGEYKAHIDIAARDKGSGASGARYWAGKEAKTKYASPWLRKVVDDGYSRPNSLAMKYNPSGSSTLNRMQTQPIPTSTTQRSQVFSSSSATSYVPATYDPLTKVPDLSQPVMKQKKTKTITPGWQPDGKYMYSSQEEFTGQKTPGPYASEGKGENSSFNLKSLAKTAQKGSNLATDLAPYLSNIYNMSQKPAKVPAPLMARPVQLQRMSMANDRYQANANYRTMNRSLDESLDGNTAVAAKLVNKAQTMNAVSAFNEKERLGNLGIQNKELELNQAVDNENLNRVQQYRLQNMERDNLITSMRSANLANAADKFIANRNVRAQEELESRKIDALGYSDVTGAYERMLKQMKEEKKAYGGKLYTAGRFMRGLKPIK